MENPDPPPPKSRMEKWRVFALRASFFICGGGGGGDGGLLLHFILSNIVAFIVYAKRRGVGDEGEKGDREKGSDLLLSLSLSPTPPNPLSTPATQAINRTSSSLVRMLARGWHVLRQTDWKTGRHTVVGSDCEGCGCCRGLPLHSYSQMRFPYLRDELCIWDIFSSRKK